MTVIPANTTDRPAVPMAIDTAVRGIAAVGEFGTVPSDDQQRVVDAHAEADHRGDRTRPFGHVDDVGEQASGGEADTDAEQRRGEREAHRDQRPERDQQDDRSDEQSWPLGADAGGLGVVDRLAGELDLHTIGTCRGSQVDHLGCDIDRELCAGAVELHSGVAGRAVRRHLASAIRIPRCDDADDVRHLSNTFDQWFGDGKDAGRCHAIVVVDDNGDRVAGLRRESLVEKLDGGLRVRSGRQEVLLVLAAERRCRDVDRDQDEDPRSDDDATMLEGPGGDALQHGGPAFGCRCERFCPSTQW